MSTVDLTKRLVATVGDNDLVAGVKRRANELLAGLEGPPFDVSSEIIRKAVQVNSIKYARNMSADGRIFWQETGYVVEINGRLDRMRRRFTVAHELGHAIFLPEETKERTARTDKLTGQFKRDNEEEYLCDIFAAELLMPTDEFTKRVCVYGPSVMSVLALVKEFGTSLTATARRFVDVNAWNCHIGFWRLVKGELPTFSFGFQSRGLNLRLPRNASAPPKSIIAKAASNGRQLRGWSDLGLVTGGSEKLGPVFTQAVPLGPSGLILNLCILQEYPDSLCSMFDELKRKSTDTSRVQASFHFPRMK